MEAKEEGNYIITEANRDQAVDEIVEQLTDRANPNDIHLKALRNYANKLLDEFDEWRKYDLESAVSSYSNGIEDGEKLV